MKFFVPLAKDTEEAQSVINSTAEFIGNPVTHPNQMIYQVNYQHNGKDMIATVGDDVDGYYREAAPIVLAIFPPHYNGAPIKICLRDRGVVRGEPIYVDGESPSTSFEGAN